MRYSDHYDDYDYDYNDLAENADYEDDAETIEEDNETAIDGEDDYDSYMRNYNNYYHDIVDELDD